MIELAKEILKSDPIVILLFILLIMVSTGFVTSLIVRSYLNYRFRSEALRAVKYQNKGRYIVKDTINTQVVMDCMKVFMEYLKHTEGDNEDG